MTSRRGHDPDPIEHMLEGSREGDEEWETAVKEEQRKEMWGNEEEIENIYTSQKLKRWWDVAWMKTQQECWGKEPLNSLRAYAVRIRPNSSLGVTGLTNPNYTSSPWHRGLPALPLYTLNLLNLTRFPLISHHLTLSPDESQAKRWRCVNCQDVLGPKDKEREKKKQHLKKCVQTRTLVRKPFCARQRQAINIHNTGIRWWQSSSGWNCRFSAANRWMGRANYAPTFLISPASSWPYKALYYKSTLHTHIYKCVRLHMRLFCILLWYLHTISCLRPKTLPEQPLNKNGWINRWCCQADALENTLAGWQHY